MALITVQLVKQTRPFFHLLSRQRRTLHAIGGGLLLILLSTCGARAQVGGIAPKFLIDPNSPRCGQAGAANR